MFKIIEMIKIGQILQLTHIKGITHGFKFEMHKFKCHILILFILFWMIIMIGRYNKLNLLQHHRCHETPSIRTQRYTISLTSLDPTINNVSRGNFITSDIISNNLDDVIINQISNTFHVNGFINNHVNDDGPMTKISGLCGIIDEIRSPIIIYLDDDIDYDLSQLDYLASYVKPGLIIGREGGFYIDQELIHLRYIEEQYDVARCFTESEVVMGYGAVGLHRSDLIKVCDMTKSMIIPMELKFIDDETLSVIYRKLNISLLTSRRLNTYMDLTRSRINPRSRKSKYPIYRKLLSQIN